MLPQQYSRISLPIKYYLSSYRACSDCQYAIQKLKNKPINISDWKIEWAGICSILKASIHLMRKKDAKSCMPALLKKELISVWERLGANKEQYPLFWNFIDKERNNILKEYEFSAYQVLLSSDGTIKTNYSLLSILSEEEKMTLQIHRGYYAGRFALDVAEEAANWVEETLLNAIKSAGYDPELKVVSESFLAPVVAARTLPASLLLSEP